MGLVRKRLEKEHLGITRARCSRVEVNAFATSTACYDLDL